MRVMLASIKRFFRILGKTFCSLSQREEIIVTVLGIVIILSTYFLFTNQNEIKPIPESDQGNVIAIPGGAYSEGIIGQIKRLNPLFIEFNQADRDISGLIFSGLSKYDPIQEKIVEDIATHTLSLDKKVYTFTLKENVTWHDGQPVTAEDIYFTYHDVIQHPDFPNPVLKSNLEGIEISILDQRSVEFKLKEPNSFFFTSLTVGLIPKHILSEIPVIDLIQHEFNLNPIGTGPYFLAEPPEINPNKQTAQIYLQAFPDYYGSPPYIQDLRFLTFPDEETLIKNKKSLNGLAKIASPEEWKKLKKDSRFQLYGYSLPQYTAVFINHESPFLKNQKTRLGLLKSIDKELLINQLGFKIRIDTPLLELNQEEWINRFDSKEAMGALYDSGWNFPAGNTNEIRQNKKGDSFSLRLIVRQFSENPVKANEQNQVLDFLIEAWRNIGVDVSAEELSNEDFNNRLQTRDYDLVLTGQSLGYNLDTYSYWHSSQASETGLNLSNYKSPIADNLIETIRRLFDPEEKAHKLEKLGEAIADDVPAIFLYTPVYYYAVDQNIKDVRIGTLGFPSDRLTNLPNWYIKVKPQ